MPDSFPSALTSNCETLVFRNASVSSQAERQSTQHRAELWVNLLSLKKCTLRSPLCCLLDRHGSFSVQVCFFRMPSVCPQHNRSVNAERRLGSRKATAIRTELKGSKGTERVPSSHFNSEQRQDPLPSPHFPQMANSTFERK